MSLAIPANRARILLGLLLVALAGSSTAQSATEVLKRSMERHHSVTAIALQSHRMNNDSNTRFVVQYLCDGNGKWRRSIIQPLKLEGHITQFDGKTMTMVSPRDKTVVRQRPSPDPDTARRFNLIQNNYRISKQRDSVVAGRAAFVVFCSPKTKGLPSRRVFVDKQNYFTLRSEIISPDGSTELIFDTLSAEFPARLPHSALELDLPAGYKTIDGGGFTREESVESASKQVQFEPIVPKRLPFGFVLEDVDVLRRGERGMLAFRLTDGFVTITSYQWDSRVSPRMVGTSDQYPVREERGVKMMFVSEIPTGVLNRIIESFIKMVLLAWDLGTQPPTNCVGTTEKPN